MGDSFQLNEPKEGGEFEPIPTDTFLDASVVSCEKVRKPWNDDNGNPVEKVAFRFKVVEDGDYFGRNVWGETTTNFVNHDGCKLFGWVKTLLGLNDLTSGFRFNTDDLVGQQARVLVETKEYIKDGTPKVRNFVSDVLPVRGRAVPAASVASGFDSPDPEEPF